MNCTTVSAVQFFGRFEDWPENVVYVGMPGKASAAFGIPADIAIHGKPWECVNHPEAFGAEDWPEAYKNYLVARMQAWPEYEALVKGLHGKMLLCWCAKKDGPRCHAHILADFAELLYHEGE